MRNRGHATCCSSLCAVRTGTWKHRKSSSRSLSTDPGAFPHPSLLGSAVRLPPTTGKEQLCPRASGKTFPLLGKLRRAFWGTRSCPARSSTDKTCQARFKGEELGGRGRSLRRGLARRRHQRQVGETEAPARCTREAAVIKTSGPTSTTRSQHRQDPLPRSDSQLRQDTEEKEGGPGAEGTPSSQPLGCHWRKRGLEKRGHGRAWESRPPGCSSTERHSGHGMPPPSGEPTGFGASSLLRTLRVPGLLLRGPTGRRDSPDAGPPPPGTRRVPGLPAQGPAKCGDPPPPPLAPSPASGPRLCPEAAEPASQPKPTGPRCVLTVVAMVWPAPRLASRELTRGRPSAQSRDPTVVPRRRRRRHSQLTAGPAPALPTAQARAAPPLPAPRSRARALPPGACAVAPPAPQPREMAPEPAVCACSRAAARRAGWSRGRGADGGRGAERLGSVGGAARGGRASRHRLLPAPQRDLPGGFGRRGVRAVPTGLCCCPSEKDVEGSASARPAALRWT